MCEAIAATEAPGLRTIALTDELLALHRWLDRAFDGWCEGREVRQLEASPLISADALERVGYFAAFPNMVVFPAVLDRDPDQLSRFAAGRRFEKDGALRLPELRPMRTALSPAACYQSYPLYAGQALASPELLNVRGTCFRCETEHLPLRRQASFTMRELVCIGGEADVISFLDRGRRWLQAFAARLGLAVSWRDAFDPFFAAERSGRALMQRLKPLKQELVFGDGLALASVNRHEAFFGRAFSITSGGAPAHSGCIAAGVERWIYAVLAARASNPRGWPGQEPHAHG